MTSMARLLLQPLSQETGLVGCLTSHRSLLRILILRIKQQQSPKLQYVCGAIARVLASL
uniref:Uncharacterized protein n=1 Tax=Peronospora matthiolae TaxID=2874970 RepID=A0AAV1V3R1_9STRA